MRKSAASIRRCLATFLIAIVSAPAFGAGQRSFVASTGDDLSTCTLTAPCRSFARAITQTNADGEIIVLDSAGYGPVVVDKSVAIIAPAGVYAGISVFSGHGIVINGSGIKVLLRGLAINGQGGDRGIFYTFGSRLRVENCVVSNMSGHGINIGYPGDIVIADTVVRGNGGSGIRITTDNKVVVERTRVEGNVDRGIEWQSTFSSELSVRDSLISGNDGEGIHALSSGPDGNVTLTGTTLTGNNRGVWAFTGGAGDSLRLFAQDNVVTRNGPDGFLLQTQGLTVGTLTATLVDNMISGHSNGIRLFLASGVTAVLDRNTITDNSVGIDQGNGVIQTRSNNTVRLNGTNVSNGPLMAVGGT